MSEGWTEQDMETRKVSKADAERASLLDLVKKENLPTIKKEAESGGPGFKPIDFQPIRSPGIYEAEFAVKEKDIIFHFFPHGYARAAHQNLATPPFKPGFLKVVKEQLALVFDAHRVDIQEDKDLGGISAKARGWGDSSYARDLCIKVCEAIHKKMGGEPG